MMSTSTSSTIPRTSFCALFNILNSGDSRSFAEICLIVSCHYNTRFVCVLCSFCLLYTVENWSSLDDDPICICQLDNFKATDEAPSGHWARDAVVVVDVSLQRPLHLATPPSSSSWTSLRRLIWSFDAREECARARCQRWLFTCLGLGQIIPLVRRMVLSPGF